MLVQSEEMPADTPLIEGPDFNKDLSLSDLLATYKHMGFQASGLGKAIDIVNKMVSRQEDFGGRFSQSNEILATEKLETLRRGRGRRRTGRVPGP